MIDKQLLDVIEFVILFAVLITLSYALYTFVNADYYRGYLAEDSALMLSVVEIGAGDVSVEHDFRGLVYDVSFGEDKGKYYFMFMGEEEKSVWSEVMHNKGFEIDGFRYENKRDLSFNKKGDVIEIK